MYIKPTRAYYSAHGQHASRELFLILCEPEGTWQETRGFDYLTQTRAIVRKVAMQQCGHFMMGTARAYGHSLTLSGSYGNDGLVKRVPREVYEKAIPVPPDLMKAWNDGGGWNGCGSEAESFRAWALENLDALRGGKVSA